MSSAFDNSNNLMVMMEKVVMQVLKKNGLLTGNKVFGVVEEVVNDTTLRVYLQQSMQSELVKCSPKATFNLGDRVLIEYINNNPHDKFVMALVHGGYGVEPIDYDSLPTEPVEIIRRDDGKAYKFIYAYDQPTKTWSQELIRDVDTDKVTSIKHVYPDGAVMIRYLVKDTTTNKLHKYE